MTATLFAGWSGNFDSSDSTSSVATKDSTSSDKTLKVAVFDMPTLYLMQTFNDMGYYKDNGFFLFIQTLFQLMARAIQMVINAVAEAVTTVVNGIGRKVTDVIDISNRLDGVAAIFLNK